MNAIVIAGLLVLWPLGVTDVRQVAPEPSGPPGSPAELQALHAAMLARINTIVLEEKVIELRKALPGEDEQSRTDMAEAFARMHAEAAASRVLSPQQARQLDAELEQRLASIEGASIVLRLNRAVALERRTTIDFVRGAVRYDTRDLRDLDRLAAENGLTPLDLVSLDKGGVHIATREGCVELMPRAQKLALVSSRPRYSRDEQACKLGLLPSWVFSGDFELELQELVPTLPEELELVGRRDGVVAFVATLRADLGYRLTAFRTFDGNRPFQSWLMWDFRKVGDCLIPHATVWTLFHSDVHERVVERREVRRVFVDAPVPLDAFAIPSDYRVQQIHMQP